MKKILIALFVIPILAFGANLMMNPWNLDTGQIVVSLGLPIVDFRAGILDFLEVGASTYVRGGYVKLGFKLKNFAISGGYAMFPGISGFFSDLGIRFGDLEFSLGGIYYQTEWNDSRDYVLEGEMHYTFRKSDGVSNGVGLHFYRDSFFVQNGVQAITSIYFDGKFKEVFFFDYITILGGVQIALRSTGFDPFNDMGVIVGLSTSVRIFGK